MQLVFDALKNIYLTSKKRHESEFLRLVTNIASPTSESCCEEKLYCLLCCACFKNKYKEMFQDLI